MNSDTGQRLWAMLAIRRDLATDNWRRLPYRGFI